MARKSLFITFLLLILFSFGAAAEEKGVGIPSILDILETETKTETRSRPSAYEDRTVTSIEVSGVGAQHMRESRDAIFSKVGETFIEQKVQADVKAIYALGYFADVKADTFPYRGGVKVIYVAEENPAVTAVNFDGNMVFSDEALAATMETKIGETLNYSTLREDIKRIDSKYKSAGYLLARVVDVSTDQDGALTLKIVEGFIESIKISGNENTQEYVIRRELKTRPGTVLNERTLTRDLRSVFNLGFFSEVNPAFEPGEEPDEIVLVIRVKEQRTSTINLGGGYGEREGWFGFVDLSVNNLFGTGRAMMIRGQSGQELQTYQFKYFDPWVLEDYFGDHLSFTFKRWHTIGSDFYFVGQNEIHNGYDVTFGKPLADVWRLSWSLGSEWVGPYSDSSFEAYDTLTTGLSLSYDTRDIWLNPTEGVFHTVSTRWGWKYCGGVTQFTKYGLDFNFYFPVAERLTLALHAGAGLGVGDVPIGERYWVGSANTVRGFYPSEANLGFRKLQFNAEYRYTFNEIFQGVLFFDFGNAWDTGAPIFGDFLSGEGFGIRMTTPLGPIRLDYAIGNGKEASDGVIHFSIGQAF